MPSFQQNYNAALISSATTTQVTSTPCTLHAIVVGTTSAGSIKIIDDLSSNTTNIGELQASILPGTYIFDCPISKGLRIITAGASIITVLTTY